MSKYNAWFGATGYGSRQFYVTHVQYGVETITRQVEGANDRSIYFRNVINDNFVVSLVFESWSAYQAGGQWFQGYMAQAADPNTNISPMVVQVASKNFLGTGIPETGVSFGDHVGAIIYPVTISFTGTSNYANATEANYQPPVSVSPTPGAGNQNYYPLDYSTTNGSSSAVESALFDAPPTTVAPYPTYNGYSY